METVTLRCPKCKSTSVVPKEQASRGLNCTSCLLDKAKIVKLVEVSP